ncbi:MAG: DUF302 domain-containing protein [Ktedonobacterales bacterium]
MSETYGFAATLNLPFDQAVAQVKDALQAEGFGVLTEIDVQQIMRDKLHIEMPAYRILGACNPHLAHQALEQDPDIGVLLPCTVVVRATNTGSWVGIADPQAMLSITGSDSISAVASEAKQRLQRVLSAMKRGAQEQ